MVKWNCAFLLPNRKIKFGVISQERGLELVNYINQIKRPFTIHNTEDNLPFVVLDVLVMEVSGEEELFY
jgi:hypothetical protein